MTEPDETVPWSEEHGLALRKKAAKVHRLAVAIEPDDPAGAESEARRGLAIAASAFNWLEDSEWEDAAHEELDTYGAYVREHFPDGCELGWTGSSYEHRCPVSVAHKRIGFSIGFTAKRFCSICDGDLSECEHLPGKFYDVEGGPSAEGRCRVCAREACADHHAGTSYRARAVSVIKEAEMHEISLVGKPRHPDARLVAVPIDSDRLRRHLGKGFEMGMRVSCDQCLMGCPGLDRPFDVGSGGHA